MSRAGKIWRGLAAVVLGGCLLGAVALSVGHSADAASMPGGERVAALVGAALPGASGELVESSTGFNGEGSVLSVEVPRTLASAAVTNPFAIARAAWRTRLVAAVLASEYPHVTGYQIRSPGISATAVPEAVLGELTGMLPPRSDLTVLTKLGSVTEQQALGQLESNAATLRSGMPDQAEPEISIEPVVLGGDGNHVAFEIDVKVGDRAAVRPYLGDIFDGLQTGLVGSDASVIDGLAITLSENSGPVAGSWIATSALSGSMLSLPDFGLPESLRVTMPFTSIVGGPPAADSATAAGKVGVDGASRAETADAPTAASEQ